MSSLIRKVLNGIISMTSNKSDNNPNQKVEKRMIKFVTNIPEIDKDNSNLFKAAMILQELGNDPNPTANQFYAQLAVSDLPTEDYDGVVLAAMAIETMMQDPKDPFEELAATVH